MGRKPDDPGTKMDAICPKCGKTHQVKGPYDTIVPKVYCETCRRNIAGVIAPVSARCKLSYGGPEGD